VYYRFHLDAPASAALSVDFHEPQNRYLHLLSGDCEHHDRIDYAVSLLSFDAGPPRLAVGTLEPGDYLVVLSGHGLHDEGPFTLDVAFGPPQPRPDNDTCQTATQIDSATREPRTVEGNTTWASEIDFSRGVFYTFELEDPASFDAVLVGDPPWPTALDLSRGDCDAPEWVDHEDISGPEGSGWARLTALSLAPGRYSIEAAGAPGDNSGPFQLTTRFGDAVRCGDAVCTPGFEHARACPEDCQPPVAPANDRCERATAIDATGTQELAGTTIGAANEDRPTWAPDVFHRFRLTEPMAVDLRVDSDPAWDTWLQLDHGGCGARLPVASDDGAVGSSRITLPSLPAGQYYLVTSGRLNTDQGDFDGTVTFSEAEVLVGDP